VVGQLYAHVPRIEINQSDLVALAAMVKSPAKYWAKATSTHIAGTKLVKTNDQKLANAMKKVYKDALSLLQVIFKQQEHLSWDDLEAATAEIVKGTFQDRVLDLGRLPQV
jgi:uncharacterized membrane protein YheB (UPF0754 family)